MPNLDAPPAANDDVPPKETPSPRWRSVPLGDTKLEQQEPGGHIEARCLPQAVLTGVNRATFGRSFDMEPSLASGGAMEDSPEQPPLRGSSLAELPSPRRWKSALLADLRQDFQEPVPGVGPPRPSEAPEAEPTLERPPLACSSPGSPTSTGGWREGTGTDVYGCPSPRGPLAQSLGSSYSSLAAVLASAAADEKRQEEARQNERQRQLDESARRLRDNVERVRAENRRHRVFGVEQSLADGGDSVVSAPGCIEGSDDTVAAADAERPQSGDARRLDEMRRRIEQLDELNQLEQQKLWEQEREVEERRRAQEEFERGILEKTEREIREHREREKSEEAERNRRAELEGREREEREKRRQEQLQQEQEQSRRLEEQRRQGQAGCWHVFEEELDKQWAEQEKAERQRLQEYAARRRQQYEEWDKKLFAERAKWAPQAEFSAANRRRQAKHAATADENYYDPRRNPGQPAPPAGPRTSNPRPRPPPKPPPQAVPLSDAMSPEERTVLKELQSVKLSSRDNQKAKVKELLFKWHPDKNPERIELATKLFQFVQKQRELVLGL